MLRITADDAHGCLLLEPSGPLTERDLDALKAQVDAAAASGRMPNLVIVASAFPAWTDIATLLKHVRFIRTHHRRVRRVAFVSDARALSVAPRLARALVRAEVRQFGAEALDAALAWVGERR